MTASQRSGRNGPAGGVTDTRETVLWVALALAAVHLVAIVQPAPSVLSIALFEGAVVLALVAVEFWLTRSIRQAVSLGAVAGTTVGGVWLSVRLGLPLWQVAVGSLGLAAVLGYGLHRYQLVSLGRVEVTDGN